MPSRLGLLLDMTARQLESVIYYEKYLIVDPGKTPFETKQLLTEEEYSQAQIEYGEDAFVAKMGAEALRDVLAALDLRRSFRNFRSRCRTRVRSRLKSSLRVA